MEKKSRQKERDTIEDNEERYRLALEAADIMTWDWDPDSDKFIVSDNFCRIFGLQSGSFDNTYTSFIRLIHEDDCIYIDNILKNAVKKKHSYDSEFRVSGPGKTIRWMRIRGDVYLNESGKPYRLMGSLHDKTERKLALESLKNAHDVLEQRVEERTGELSDINRKLRKEISERKKLQKEIMEISEREQQRIGQELHDNLSQQLGGVIFMSQALLHDLEKNKLKGVAEIKKIISYLNNALKHTRDLSRGLYPVFAPGEFFPALRELTATMEELYSLNIIVQDEGVRGKFSDETAIHLYRIIQEAVNNAIKHGRADRVIIEFRENSKNIFLKISDNGTGFPQKINRKGLGLNIIRYRATMIGADFEIKSSRADGAKLIFNITKGEKVLNE